MARTATTKRRSSSISWLKAGDVRLVIKEQDARDRQILKALDSLVKTPRPGRKLAA